MEIKYMDEKVLIQGLKNKEAPAFEALLNIYGDKTSEDYKAFREILGSVLSKEKDYKKKYKQENTKIKDSILNKIMIELAKEYNLTE
jgi:uncharacterized protein (UPF0297 family)